VNRIQAATVEDAPEILALQKLAYQSEAQLYGDWTIPPLTQTLESLIQEFGTSVVLKALAGDRLAGSVRARARGDVCEIGRLVVHPELQGRGIGSSLLREIEAMFDRVARYELFTGSRSEGNIRLYRRHGYAITRTQSVSPALSLVFLEKTNHRK
jgi:ribosomal protein S18 acetylase RimI-like enzyme